MSTNRSRSTSSGSRTARKGFRSKRDKRVLSAILLTLIFPPLGLFYLWNEGVFRERGRLFMTIISMVEMTLIIALILPAKSPISMQTPQRSVPVAVTVAPTGEVINALSNIDQLLADQQAQSAAENPEVTPQPTDQSAYLAQQEAILNTEVYSVYGSSAKYYHSVEVCGTQSNRRKLTVRDALQENMGACPNCNPPIYTG